MAENIPSVSNPLKWFEYNYLFEENFRCRKFILPFFYDSHPLAVADTILFCYHSYWQFFSNTMDIWNSSYNFPVAMATVTMSVKSAMNEIRGEIDSNGR